MLYWIYSTFHINLFHYITLRAGVAFFIAFILTLFLMPSFIKWAKNQKMNQPIFGLAPDSHQKKGGTPTMGGIVFSVSTLIASLITVKLDNMYVLLAIMIIILFSAIGAQDDISKIIGKTNQAGLSAKTKLLLQIIFALIVSSALYFMTNIDHNLYVPFYKYPVVDMKYLAIPFWVTVIVATSNAVNLTDGLDGLATVPSIFAFLSLGTFVYISGNAILSSHFLLPKIIGIGEVSIIASAFVGSLVGFLWYNCHPAEVFMGDSGSLSIGAFMGYMAIISKNEILLIIIGFIFVLETLSVILQVGSFKTRKKRIFKMAPLHHHFEIHGWAESKIIVRFWIIAMIANIIALITIKIR
ncbi:MAG: phospho-N-acetylmuramoyl-pentapeptide-transferase [Epsilonproteobacteria bacterium]|nr:phospho-N-acetylmuramoyl-pentapeptide-transferase [Campylobacterota bacterium]